MAMTVEMIMFDCTAADALERLLHRNPDVEAPRESPRPPATDSGDGVGPAGASSRLR